MALVRVSVGPNCLDGDTCHGVWVDNEQDPEYALVVGEDLDPAPIPLAQGERVVRLRRVILHNANL